MTAILGSGEHRYRVEEDWAKLPEGWELKDVAAVAVDSKDRVYAFNRGEHPMIVFDAHGNFLSSWGEGTFPRAHGLHIDANDILYCTDDGGHFVRKCTTEGKVLLEIGVPGKPAPYMSGLPFHRCTHTALSPQGEIYVSDGYGNARVHKYAPDGKLLAKVAQTRLTPPAPKRATEGSHEHGNVAAHALRRARAGRGTAPGAHRRRGPRDGHGRRRLAVHRPGA